MSLGVLMRHLVDGPYTFTELAELTGLAYCTVREWVGALHVQGVVFIAGYRKDRRDRDNAPLWHFGVRKKDAKRSKLTGAERQQRSRDRRKHIELLHMMAGQTSA